MRKKVINIITALIMMAILLFLGVATIFRKTGSVSYQENRKLTQLPEITLSSLMDGTYIKGVQSCFADYFAGRSYWNSANAVIDAKLCESIVNGVYITDGMMLAVPENKENSAKQTAEKINAFCEDYDGAVYVATVPSSAGVYSEKLPDYCDRDYEKKLIDELYASLDSGIRKIDAYNILKMLNENYIYYRNDSKWTGYGAYCVYRTVIQKLGFMPSAYDKYTIRHVSADFRGNLYNRTQYTDIKADMLDIYKIEDGAEILSCTAYDNEENSYEKELYDMSKVDTNDMYKLYMGYELPYVKIKTSVNNERKLLVIKDSYADCFIPFLAEHYSEIAVIAPEYAEDTYADIIDIQEYEQTLFLFGIESVF